MTDVAALVAPAIRWHDEYRYELAESEIAAAVALGCLGVQMHGGPLAATSALLAKSRAAAPNGLFAAAEMGGGAGERFPGATALPPLGAFDASDLEAVRRAARLTAREARAAGINWVLAPSCVQQERTSVIRRARTFAGDDAVVAAACAEWVDACQAEGVIAAPGPYPLMRASVAEAALDSGAHALVLATEHATDAKTIAYLRDEAGFDGVIAVPLAAVADARGEDEEHFAVACLTAGVDLLLGADDTVAVVRALRIAERDHVLESELIRDSCGRIERLAAWADVSRPGRETTLDDALWARRLADASVRVQRGRAPALVSPVDVVIVDDDPPRFERAGNALVETLIKVDLHAVRVETLTGDSRGPVVIALFGDQRIALGFDTFSDGALARVSEVADRATRSARDAVIVHFTPPDFARSIGGEHPVVCAWSGTRAMEEAAARWLQRGG